MSRSTVQTRTLPALAAALTALLWTAGTSAIQPDDTAPRAPRSFDARVEANRDLELAPATEQAAAIDQLRASQPELAASFDPATGATRSLYNRTGYLTDAAPEATSSARQVAFDFVQRQLPALGLTAQDLTDAEVTDDVFTKVTGATHIYWRQRYQGLPVFNGQLHVNVNRDRRVISVNNAFMPRLASAANGTTPALSAADAVLRAASHLELGSARTPKLVQTLPGPERRTTLQADDISLEPIEASLMWLPIRRGQARLVWNFMVYTRDRNHVYTFNVDAADGKVWTRFDQVDNATYRVYPIPTESPNHAATPPPADGRTLLTDPQDATASPLGWHDNGTTSYTILRGNNVYAYQDRDANNLPPASNPDCGAGLACDFNFPIDFATQDPTTYEGAAVSSVFYWSNIIHDVQYQYGFDEAGGNFQVNTFGNGGAGNDAVNAEAQDGSGTNNANFFTPADGSAPRMQMYLFTSTSPRRDGDLDSGIMVHEYGHGISNRLVGGPSNVACLENSQEPGEGLSDWWSLVYTAQPGDTGPKKRGVGTYAIGQPTTGNGIRTQPYSTDPAINNHTYESIDGMAIPHGVGEVWAQGAWEVYWALVDQHGYDADLYNATGDAGNQRAMLYVNEGLKNTICSPAFTDVRDGIIQAAVDNHGGEDVCLIWEAFAAFGLGTDAVSGGPDSTSPTNGFGVPGPCLCQPYPVADAGPDQVTCRNQAVQLGTTAQASTTYLWAPGGETTAQISVSPSNTTSYTLSASTMECGTEQDMVTVFVDTGSNVGLSQNFEAGLGSWTASGLWHLVTNSGCATPALGYSSPVSSVYYGQDANCTYNTGAGTTGDLVSPPILGITADSTLSFDYFRRVESFGGGSFDRTEVHVLTNSGATSTTVFALDSTDPSSSAWTSSGSISLAAFAGQAIQIRFRFNSVDGVDNNFTGWMIDDVVVTGTTSCDPGEGIFADGFEAGNTSAWDSQVP